MDRPVGASEAVEGAAVEGRAVSPLPVPAPRLVEGESGAVVYRDLLVSLRELREALQVNVALLRGAGDRASQDGDMVHACRLWHAAERCQVLLRSHRAGPPRATRASVEAQLRHAVEGLETAAAGPREDAAVRTARETLASMPREEKI